MSQIRTPRLDFGQADCVTNCRNLLEAYNRMLSGGQRTEVRHGDYWVIYRANKPADMTALRNLYMAMRTQCPEAMHLLPDISPSARVVRGPGARLIIGG
jgi:hypothetical protein